MRLILHIGSSKTGTTTIQQFFCRNQRLLLKQGILYPVRMSHTAHHVLMPASFVQKEKYNLPNNRFYMNNSDRFWSSFRAFWSSLMDDINKHKPHTVILSAETLFHDFSTISNRSFSEFLGQYFDDIQVIAYIRSPAPDYKSRVAQQIRTAKKILPPQVRPIKKIIEYFESEFPGKVRLYPFEKKQLIKGNVLKDFLVRNLPEALSLMGDRDAQFKNVALPPMLLQRLQRLRLSVQPKGTLPNISTNALVVWYSDMWAKNYKELAGSESMELKFEIKEYLQNSAIDYKWLRDKYSVNFNDLDYSKIEEKNNPFEKLNLLEDIFDLNMPFDKGVRKLNVPTNKFVRLLITARFIFKTQVTGMYRAHVAHAWLGKVKRGMFKCTSPSHVR